MRNSLKHFYLYRGNSTGLFHELTEMLGCPSKDHGFEIYEPKDKTKMHCLLIVYGMPLAGSYCYQKNIWSSDENIFNSFYLPHLNDFETYGYKETSDRSVPISNIEGLGRVG